MEKRKGHLAGMSPTTILAMAVTLSSVVGGYYVMQDDIADQESEIERLRDTVDKLNEEHTRLWVRMGIHGHK